MILLTRILPATNEEEDSEANHEQQANGEQNLGACSFVDRTSGFISYRCIVCHIALCGVIFSLTCAACERPASYSPSSTEKDVPQLLEPVTTHFRKS